MSSPKQTRMSCAPAGALALVGLCLLGGCVTSGTEPASTSAPVKLTAMQCVDELAAKPEYEPLRGKTYLGSGDQPAAGRDRPTAAETALLDAMNAELRACRQLALAEAPPARATKLAELHRAAEKLWSEAAAGRLTWDQFNQRRRTIVAQEQALLTAPASTAAAPRKQDMFALDPPRSDEGGGWDAPRQKTRGRSFSPHATSRGYCNAANKPSAYCYLSQ